MSWVRDNIFSAFDCGHLFGSVVVVVICRDETWPRETNWWSGGWTVIVIFIIIIFIIIIIIIIIIITYIKQTHLSVGEKEQLFGVGEPEKIFGGEVILTPSQYTQVKEGMLANAKVPNYHDNDYNNNKIKIITTTIKPIDVIVDGMIALVNPDNWNIYAPNPTRPFVNSTFLRFWQE